MSRAHDLQPVNCPARACWRLLPAEPEKTVHVTIHARGPETVVGVHFQRAADPPVHERDLKAVILVGAGASIASFPLFGDLFGFMFLYGELWLTFVALAGLAPSWRRRREFRAWSRAWSRRFWADLAARLAVSSIYR